MVLRDLSLCMIVVVYDRSMFVIVVNSQESGRYNYFLSPLAAQCDLPLLAPIRRWRDPKISTPGATCRHGISPMRTDSRKTHHLELAGGRGWRDCDHET